MKKLGQNLLSEWKDRYGDNPIIILIGYKITQYYDTFHNKINIY